MVIRGTPFIAAVIMSAAAMLLMPDAILENSRPSGQTAPPAGTAMHANLGDDVTVPPPVQAVQPAPAGTARTLRNGQVTLNATGFWSRALIDRRSGAVSGSTNQAARSDTASMIKS